MPGNAPPTYPILQASLSELQSLTYDSNDLCYVDSRSQKYFLYVEQDGGSDLARGQLYLAEDGQAGDCPKVEIPTQANTVLSGGTFNNGYVDYGGDTYGFQAVNASGKLQAQAIDI